MSTSGKLGFKDKAVIIPGRCSGIGAVLARLPAASAAKVMIVSRNRYILTTVAYESTTASGV